MTKVGGNVIREACKSHGYKLVNHGNRKKLASRENCDTIRNGFYKEEKVSIYEERRCKKYSDYRTR